MPELTREFLNRNGKKEFDKIVGKKALKTRKIITFLFIQIIVLFLVMFLGSGCGKEIPKNEQASTTDSTKEQLEIEKDPNITLKQTVTCTASVAYNDRGETTILTYVLKTYSNGSLEPSCTSSKPLSYTQPPKCTGNSPMFLRYAFSSSAGIDWIGLAFSETSPGCLVTIPTN